MARWPTRGSCCRRYQLYSCSAVKPAIVFSRAFLRFNCVWEFSTRRHVKFVCLYLLRKIELLADNPPHLDYWKARPCSQIQVFQVKVQVFISTQMKSSLLMAFFFRAPGDWKFCAAGRSPYRNPHEWGGCDSGT